MVVAIAFPALRERVRTIILRGRRLSAVVHPCARQIMVSLSFSASRKQMFLPKSDKEFASWMGAHPDGFVLNTAATPSASYMVLHKATCPMISPARMGVARGACTQHQYRKVCAEDIDDLRAWVRRRGRPDSSFSKRCGRCNP
jgi:hypothetical protein